MRRAIRGVLSEVGGSATRTIASGSRPSANTSPNCSTSRIVIPSSNSPFANFLLLGDRSAPGGRKRSIFSGVRSGSKRLCGKRANTRCRYPHGTSHTGRGNANALLPLPRCLVKLLAPVPMRAAVSSDPSPTHRALAPSITCGPKRSCLSSRCGFGSVEWHQPPDRTRRIQMVDAGRRFATCEAHSP